jgi:hypothetical protein
VLLDASTSGPRQPPDSSRRWTNSGWNSSARARSWRGSRCGCSAIWEWGHNLGAFGPDHPAFDGFPHDGFSALQFFRIIDRGRKIILDGCPFAPEPIVHAVDIPMMTYSPEMYGRKAACLFELQVGRGRIFVSGFNFSAEMMQDVEVRTLFHGLVRYANSDAFHPSTQVDPKAFRAWTGVVAEGANPRPGPETGRDSGGFYCDRDRNGLNKFEGRGEGSPVVDAPYADGNRTVLEKAEGALERIAKELELKR